MSDMENVFAAPRGAVEASSLSAPSPSPLLKVADTGAAVAAFASDWLKGPRRAWNSAVSFIAKSQVVTFIFIFLPSLFISGVLIFISVGLGPMMCQSYQGVITTECVKALEPTTQAVLGTFGVLAGLTYVVLIAAAPAVYANWPGVLSICSWQTGVMGNWFLMSLVLFTLGSSYIFSRFISAFLSIYAFYYAFMKFLWGVFFPATIIWGLSSEVMAKRRQFLSGE